MSTTSVNLRIDKELKRQAEELFDKLGINMTTAMNIFLRQAVREQGIPFRLSAAVNYDDIEPYKPDIAGHRSYQEYVIDNLRQSDMKVAEGSMSYYTESEMRSKIEGELNEKIQD